MLYSDTRANPSHSIVVHAAQALAWADGESEHDASHGFHRFPHSSARPPYSNATKGYQLRTLERERSLLLLDEEVLKMQIAQAQALMQLEGDKIIQAMIPVGKAQYTNQDTTVASTQEL